jgi:glycosyltransferase involved in cell wall biosynthesis
MFHIGEIPWKASLLLIVYLALMQLRSRRFSEIAPAAPTVFLAIVLIVFTILGAVTHWFAGGPMPAGETIRLITIFSLIPLSFIVGFSNTRKNHVYIGWIMIAMVATIFSLFVLYEQFDFLVAFYDLDAAYELAGYDANSPTSRTDEIFQKLNISSVAITVLMTYMAIGIAGFITYAVLFALFASAGLFVALPFFLPGVVNAFMFSPQFVVLISILAGMVMRHMQFRRRLQTHDLDVVFIAVDHGLSIDNSPVLRAQVLDAASHLTTGGYKVGVLINIEAENSTTLDDFKQQLQEIQTVRSGSLPPMLIKSAWKLNRLDRKQSIRTLYVRGIWGAVIAHLAFPTFNGPELVYDFRGDVVAEAKNSGTKGVRLVILRLLTQLAIRSATKHLSVSAQGAAKVTNSYGAKTVIIIPSSTDTHRFEIASSSRSETREQLGIANDDIVYVYAGGLAQYQMIPEMLKIWSKLDNRNAKFMFLTSKQPGKNINISEYESLIPEGTIVLSLDPNEVPIYLAAADIGFLLREQNPLNTVASPVKFAEYLAAGLAVVTSPALSDASSQVTDHNLGVAISPKPDTDELQSLIEFTKTFPDQQQHVRTRAIKLAQTRYDWDAHIGTWRRDIFDSQQSDSDD